MESKSFPIDNGILGPKNFRVYNTNALIPVFGRIRSEFQCLQNRATIPLFGSIISENQCYKNKTRIPKFLKIRPDSSVLKDNIGILTCL